MSDAATYRELAEAAWTWTLDQVRDDDGPWLPSLSMRKSPKPRRPGTATACMSASRDRTRPRRGGTAPVSHGARAAPGRRRGRAAPAPVPCHRRRVALRRTRRIRDRAAPSRAGGRTGRAGQGRRVTQVDGMDLTRTRSVPRHGAHRHYRRDRRHRAHGAVGRWCRRHRVSRAVTLLLDDADEVEAGLDWGMVPHARPGGRTSRTGLRASRPPSRLPGPHWAGPTSSRRLSAAPSTSCLSGSSRTTGSSSHTRSRRPAARSSR